MFNLNRNQKAWPGGRRIAVASLMSLPLLGILPPAADAGTATDSLTVDASISANCTISTTALNFGAYDPIVTNKSTKLDGTGSVSVTCTNGSAVTIELDAGLNESGGPAPADPARRMQEGATGTYLSYFLYSDAGHTTKWATGAAVDVDTTGTGAAENHTVYGQVTEDQQEDVGTYSDTVTATVTF